MKNPLRKRLPRELIGEPGKYLVIFLLLTLTIGFVSGFLVADNSLIVAYQESFEKYNVEDGNFRLEERANRAQLRTIEDAGVTLYDNFYTEQPLVNGSTLRIFSNRTQVNLACLMEGAFPAQPGEIAIDRMYADNNTLSVGDTLESADGSRSWTITGLVALSDYSCLFENNSDTMFDSIRFGVAVVSQSEFAEYSVDQLVYSYSWKYKNAPADEAEEREQAEDLMEVINAEAPLEDYIPRYQNQAIQFTGDDMGSDKAMMIALLYIVIAILAFVFGVTIRNTIRKESNVIGTLRASGYTKGELVRHYMTMPLLVTLLGALIGNILGYTVMKDVCAGMYYGSYSLPTYVTLWNAEAFWLTTAVPLLLMALITFFTLWRMLSLSPLQFLRRDLRRGRQRRAFPLWHRIPFFSRFRLRIVFQNLGSYVVLLVGILFANMLLLFGMGFPAVLDRYSANIEDNLLANYQYLLQVPYDAMDEEHKLESLVAMLRFQADVETENPDAEAFSAYSMKTVFADYESEDVMLYGLKTDSRYIPLDYSGGQVYLSSAYADKYQVQVGDTITLQEAYEDDQYTFTVGGIYEYDGSLAVFMPQEQLNRTFDLGDDYFSGYLSDSEITDIDESCIGTVIDLDALTKVSRQLDVSMGSMMGLVDCFAIFTFLVIIYLLSKMIIEKNAQSISMAKILGYSNGEVSRLYLLSTSLVVVICLLISLPVEKVVLTEIFRMVMMESMTGWIPLDIDTEIFIRMFLLGLAAYAVVALLEYRRIRRVPMDEALKNVE